MQMPDVVLELVTVVVAELSTVGGGEGAWGERITAKDDITETLKVDYF